MPKVKICGMTEKETIQTAIEHKVDYLGFVFYAKSPRNLTPDQARELTKNIPPQVKKIAVLVNAKDEFIEQIKDYFDCLQLHGHEDVKRIRELKQKFNKEIIKAIRVTDEASAKTYNLFEDEVDMLLFDSPAMEKTAKFDWNILTKLQAASWCRRRRGRESRSREVPLALCWMRVWRSCRKSGHVRVAWSTC